MFSPGRAEIWSLKRRGNQQLIRWKLVELSFFLFLRSQWRNSIVSSRSSVGKNWSFDSFVRFLIRASIRIIPMATTKSTSTPSAITYDEVLSTSTLITSTDPLDQPASVDFDLTNFLLFIFPFYGWAILLNFLSVYTILTARVYRQYLSNVLFAVICIGAILNAQGQVFLILQRFTGSSSSNRLCASSLYLRDSGSILIHLHVFLLACERILANLKKQPNHLNNNLIQRAHLCLIAISSISIILSVTVPIYTLKNASFSSFNGLCIPTQTTLYQRYYNWIYYGFGHPFLWLSCILLAAFFLRRTTISYTTLIPMNRMIAVISMTSGVNLVIATLFDDMIGIGDERPMNTVDTISTTNLYLMNLRDLISIVHKLILGVLFFVYRPEIRLWLWESIQRFQEEKKEALVPQMLDVRSELDDGDDGDLQFRTDS